MEGRDNARSVLRWDPPFRSPNHVTLEKNHAGPCADPRTRLQLRVRRPCADHMSRACADLKEMHVGRKEKGQQMVIKNNLKNNKPILFTKIPSAHA